MGTVLSSRTEGSPHLLTTIALDSFCEDISQRSFKSRRCKYKGEKKKKKRAEQGFQKSPKQKPIRTLSVGDRLFFTSGVKKKNTAKGTFYSSGKSFTPNFFPGTSQRKDVSGERGVTFLEKRDERA